jgi:hypothetical protein
MGKLNRQVRLPNKGFNANVIVRPSSNSIQVPGSGTTTMPPGSPNPEEMKELLNGCPGGRVVFADRVAASVRDKQIPSQKRDALRHIQPRRNKGAVDRCPGGRVVFANRVVANVRDKQIPSKERDANRQIQPRRNKQLLIVAPVVASNSPTVLLRFVDALIQTISRAEIMAHRGECRPKPY